jgi:hypothetical protein
MGHGLSPCSEAQASGSPDLASRGGISPDISHLDRVFIRKISVFPDVASGKSDFVAASPDNSDSVASEVGPTGRIDHTSECEISGLGHVFKVKSTTAGGVMMDSSLSSE